MEPDANGNVDQGQQSTEDAVISALNGTVDGQTSGDQTNADNTGEGSNEGHPAWKEILDAVPSEFASILTPKLVAWDEGVNKKLQSVHSQYEPWKPFIENEVDPEAVNMALGLAAAIEQNPQGVYEALAEAYGFGSGQGVEGDNSGAAGQQPTGQETTPVVPNDPDDDPVAARIAELEGMVEQLASTFLADRQTQEQAEYSAALDDYMSALHETYGEFDDQVVYVALSNGGDGEEAVKGYQERLNNLVAQKTQQTPAPQIMGGGGGLPSNRVDPNSLSNADIEALIVQQLENANKET